MEDQGQGPIRWIILAALLLGAGVWYSWTAHRGPQPQAQQVFTPPPREQPTVTRAAVEVQPPAPASE